jgi:dCTP deaminase
MILSGQTIRSLNIFKPFSERTVHDGMSYGLSHAGYDIRLGENTLIHPKGFALAASLEHFEMPNNVLAQVCDKSTWARRGLSLFNTIIEPGWRGFLTLELVNHSDKTLVILGGSPIAQIVCSFIDQVPENTYTGKYQNQGPAPQPALKETSTQR